MIKRVLLVTSGNINPQDPFPKPAAELQDAAKSCAPIIDMAHIPLPLQEKQTVAALYVLWFLVRLVWQHSLVQSSTCTAHTFSPPASHLASTHHC